MALSCGRVMNVKSDSALISKNVSLLMMESQCGQSGIHESSIAKEITDYFVSEKSKAPELFIFIQPILYIPDSPLVISLDIMEKSYHSIQLQSDPTKQAEDLFRLYVGSRRFEDQKCSFNNLVQKKKNDIRPYLSLQKICPQTDSGSNCHEADFERTSVNKKRLMDNTLNLCQSFNNIVNCLAEYKINQSNHTEALMANRYYKRFEIERFNSLFQLRPNHFKYDCQRDSDKTIMTIKILDHFIDHDKLIDLLSYVESTWTRNNFAIKFELVSENVAGVVSIVPTEKGISYVPDNNNRIVYLSNSNDNESAKRVLAHEFGHVLGFPDCYIEFFDDTKNELVYYEISQKNNIMCTLKPGTIVPDDYFNQLEQNSCLFN